MKIEDLTKKQVIHVGNLNDAERKKFLKELEYLKGYGKDTTAEGMLTLAEEEYGKNACLNTNGNEALTFSPKDWYEKEGFEVFDAKQFI